MNPFGLSSRHWAWLTVAALALLVLAVVVNFGLFTELVAATVMGACFGFAVTTRIEERVEYDQRQRATNGGSVIPR